MAIISTIKGAIGNAANNVKSSLGLSSVNKTGNIQTGNSQTAGTPANTTGSGSSRTVIKAGQPQSAEYNAWANEQVIAGLRNKTYQGGNALAAGNMYGSNKRFAGNVITNSDLVNSQNASVISKMNKFNEGRGRNETFAVVDGRTTPLTLKSEMVPSLDNPSKLELVKYYASPSGYIVTQNDSGKLMTTDQKRLAPLTIATPTPNRGDGIKPEGIIHDSGLVKTNTGRTIARYLTGNYGEFGYTNKDFDTTYENKDGTRIGAAKEAGLTTFNAGREIASALATANRYRQDKKVQGAVRDYVSGNTGVIGIDGAAYVREAYADPTTVIHKDQKTGDEFIYVKGVPVSLSAAEASASKVYGDNPELLRLSREGGKTSSNWENRFDMANKYVINPVNEKVLQPAYRVAEPTIKRADSWVVRRDPYRLYEPFRSGAVDGTKALAGFPAAAIRKGAKSVDLIREGYKTPQTLYGAADAEIASRFVDPLYSSLQQSDYSPQDIAYFAGGFVPDYLTGKIAHVAKNRVVLPAKTVAGVGIDNAKIAKVNYLTPLRSEADVASHASKMIGAPVDFQTVQKRLPGVYKLADNGTYKVKYVNVGMPNVRSVLQGNNLSGSRFERGLLKALGDTELSRFGNTRQTADYLQANWGNPTKFLKENQPRRLREFAGDKIEGLKLTPDDVYTSSRKVGMSPLMSVEEAVRQINVNRRIDRMSDIVRGPESKRRADTVKLVAEKKKYTDQTRQQYGDFVTKTNTDDVARFTKMSNADAEKMLKGLGMSDAEIGSIRSVDDMYTFGGTKPPGEKVRVRTRGTAIVPTEKGILVVQEQNGLWNLPGGGVGRKERSAKGVLRELREETGLEGANPQHLFDVAGTPHRDYRGGKFVDKNKVFVVDDVIGTPKASNEVLKIGYYTPDSDMQLSRSAKKILDSYYGDVNPSGNIPRIPKDKNVYGIHATGDKLPKDLSIITGGRAESPVMYIGMDTMGASAFLGVDKKLGLLPRLPNRRIPTIETHVIPGELVARLDTKIKGRSGVENKIRKSFETEPENVFIGKKSNDPKRFFEQNAAWNEEIIPAAKREGYIASQLPKYGENKARNLIEHEMGIYDETRMVKNPWSRNFTYYKGNFIDLPQRVYLENPATSRSAPDLTSLPTSGTARGLEEKVKRATAREEYVLRDETRINKLTRKETPLIPISRDVPKGEFKRLTRPGYIDSALEVGYDTYQSGKAKAETLRKRLNPLSEQTSTKKSPQTRPRYVDPSFGNSMTKRTTVRAGILNPLSSIRKSTAKTPVKNISEPLKLTTKKEMQKSTQKATTKKETKKTTKKETIKTTKKSSSSSSSSTTKKTTPSSSSTSRSTSKSSMKMPEKPVFKFDTDLSTGKRKQTEKKNRGTEKDRKLYSVRKVVDFKKFRV